MQGKVLDVLLREGVRNQWVNDHHADQERGSSENEPQQRAFDVRASTRHDAAPGLVSDNTNVVGLVMEQPKMSEPEHDPIPLDLCRELLAGEAESLSDEEVERIRRHADAMAHLLIEIAVQGQSEG